MQTKDIALLFVALVICSCFAGMGMAKTEVDHALFKESISGTSYRFIVADRPSLNGYDVKNIIFGINIVEKGGKRKQIFKQEYETVKNGVISGSFSTTRMETGTVNLEFWVMDSGKSTTVDHNPNNNMIPYQYTKYNDLGVKNLNYDPIKDRLSFKLYSSTSNPAKCNVQVFVNGKLVYSQNDYYMGKDCSASLRCSLGGDRNKPREVSVLVTSEYEREETKKNNRAYLWV